MHIEELFVKILNMSLTASYVILAVVVLRFLFKKAPKWIICILWAISAFRLIFPFSHENIFSVFSVIPASDIITDEILYSQVPTIHSGISVLNSTVNRVISENMAPSVGASVNPMQVVAYIAAIGWLIGIAVFLIYGLFAYIKLKKKMSTATILRDNIYQSENVISPFMLGIVKPRIYIPYMLSEPALSHVINHENAHILRRDYLIKPLAFTILTLHWFNPFVWIAYLLFCRDIELACDEKVIKNMAVDARKSYSEALLAIAMRKGSIGACPLAFGESRVKDRVKMALSYKKPASWIIIVAFAACAITAVCLLTDPTSKNGADISVDANNLEQITDISQLYGTYHPAEVIYVNPLSLFYPSELEYAPYYTLAENEFTIVTPGVRPAITNSAPLYDRTIMTKEEFVALFSIDINIPDVSQYKNIEKITLTNNDSLFILDDNLWIADLHGEQIWLIYKLQTSAPYSIELESEYSRLTIDNLKSLVKDKADTITWSDFEGYEHYDVGSGLYIWQVPINDSFCVLVGGGSLSMEPMYVSLIKLSSDGMTTEDKLELRDNNVDVQKFLDSFFDISEELTWIFRPQISSIFPALPITIDMEYTTVEVAVDNGSLYIHGNDETQGFGGTHTYTVGETIYWSPLSEDSYENDEALFEDVKTSCIINFAIKNSQGEITYNCQINVQKISDNSELDYSEYKVVLAEASKGLEFTVNSNSDQWGTSFVISPK